ncbi:PIN domain-containing protein [Candidatus Gottesmanbacteria bacterium]|nr:PIN domain-containing protein [Candidatus Gottesmanbacteria bacterium]
MVILDTSIIIDHLRQNTPKTYLTRLIKKYGGESLAISIVTIQELYEGKITKKEMQEKDLLTTITPFTILLYSYEVAELAGKIARDLASPIEFSDAAIAATAIINGAQLATLNAKDFIHIPNLKIFPTLS